MFKLKDSWKVIEKVGENTPSGLPDGIRSGSFSSWNSDRQTLEMIKLTINLLKPHILIELGTFEGLGTLAMAQAANRYEPRSYLFTVDMNTPIAPIDDDPLNLGPVVDWKDREEWIGWNGVVEQRNANLILCGKERVETIFYRGVGWDVLPHIFNMEKTWDFCYQDSCHLISQIRKEWAILREHAHPGSVIVFDDTPDNDHDFLAWFKENETEEWDYRYSPLGGGQLWAEKK